VNVNLIERERRLCFDYFYDNFDKAPETFGLTHDKFPTKHNDCSVAANGFMLAAMAVGADFGYISRGEAESICIKALKTHERLETKKGFYYHFYNMWDGLRARYSELSIIDTALFLAGALTAGGFFGGETLELARKLYLRCDWEYFYCKDKKFFRMAEFDKGFDGYWDVYAEQLIMYFLAAGSPSGQNIALEAYRSFKRLEGEYGGYKFIYGWFGSLFNHQFSHAFIDFKGTKDEFGTDWFENSVKATLANRAFCMDNANVHKGYGKDGWGLTSCQTRDGYKGHIGAPPSGNGNTENVAEGTIPPCGALGAMPFTPNESISALNHFYSKPELVGKYGLKDAYNEGQGWYSDCYISIDKGVTLLMLANYERQTVWRSFCSLPEIKTAFKTLQFKKENI